MRLIPQKPSVSAMAQAKQDDAVESSLREKYQELLSADRCYLRKIARQTLEKHFTHFLDEAKHIKNTAVQETAYPKLSDLTCR